MTGIYEQITKENINKIANEFWENKAYRKLFNKVGISPYEILYLCGDTAVDPQYDIEVTTETYKKLGRKCFPKKATETEVENYTGMRFLNCVTGICFSTIEFK